MSARVYRRRRIAAALAVALVLGLVALAGGWGYTAFRFRQISSVHVPGLGTAPSDGSVNLLVVGSDTRQGLRDGGFGDAAGQRSDVVILVHLVPAARHAAVLSIPRDLYLPVAGTGRSAKINSAFNHGPGQLVQTIRNSLKIPVHHYLLVNFDGFREVVDALGGVSMYFPRPVRDDNHGRNESGLQVRSAGCRRLDGDQALALARSRYFQYQDKAGRWHADPGTDLGRIRRQQTMLRALAAKAVGRNLANPLRVNALVGSVVHSLTKDDRLTIRRAVTLARQFRAFDPARLTTVTLPVDRAVQHGGVVHRAGQPGFEAGLRQGWEQILLPSQPGATAAVARFLARPTRTTPPAPPTTAPPPKPPAPTRISVVVKNATTRQGLAAGTATALRHLGFKAANGGNAPSAPTTVLSYAPGSARLVGTVAQVVRAGRGVAWRPEGRLDRMSVVLTLGHDFKGVVPPGSGGPLRPVPPSRPPRPTPCPLGPPALLTRRATPRAGPAPRP
ncbi:MAG TPA: LCP family protein [Actinomycetes bacterium]|nr:LCP family protein [Actinomycetes bacterium]